MLMFEYVDLTTNVIKKGYVRLHGQAPDQVPAANIHMYSRRVCCASVYRLQLHVSHG